MFCNGGMRTTCKFHHSWNRQPHREWKRNGRTITGRQPFPSITITSEAIGQTMLTAERGGFMLGRKMKGNANVTVRDIMDDKCWEECSDSNPLYRTDCYHVLPCEGFPLPKGGAT